MADKDDLDSLNGDVSETKRYTKSRNLSEKKRRDSFNILIKDLANIVSSTSRKLDKSNILKQTIAFLKKNNQTQADSGQSPNSEKFRPQFLSNEEYLYLLLENLEAFVIVVACNKQIVYASDKLKEVIDLRQIDFRGKFLHDLLDEQSCLSFRDAVSEHLQHSNPAKNCNVPSFYSFNWNFRTGDSSLTATKLKGKFKHLLLPDESCCQLEASCVSSDETLCFLGVGKCQRFPISTSVTFPTKEKLEFVCKFSLEYKFIYLDQRSVNIIGYLPFDLLGLSGYDYVHHDDLEDLALCHENIMKNGESTSSPYRFRIKGDRWIWIKTKYSLSYSRWRTKPDCVVSTNYVIIDGVLSSTVDDRGSVSTTLFCNSDSTKSAAKYEPLANTCSKETDGDFGKQIFRPQPGVSIEHSPISGKNQRKQKQQQTTNSSTKAVPSITEETNTQLFVQLQQRQTNLQQQILQHERQLQTLHSQLLRSVTPETIVQQNVQIAPPPVSPFPLHSMPRGTTPLPPQSIGQMMTSPRASVWPSNNLHVQNNFPNPRHSF